MLDPDNLVYIQETVDRDSFDYAMRLDEDVEGIEDSKFQKLRQSYVDSVKALAKYCKIELEE